MTDRIARMFPTAALCIFSAVALAACGGGGGKKAAPTPPDDGEMMVIPGETTRCMSDIHGDGSIRFCVVSSGTTCASGNMFRDTFPDATLEEVEQCPMNQPGLTSSCRYSSRDLQEIHYYYRDAGEADRERLDSIHGAACRATDGTHTIRVGSNTPTPTPTSTYIAVAFGAEAAPSRGWAWGMRTGTSASAAESSALTSCRGFLPGSSCVIRLRGETDVCQVVAVSECPSGSCRTPAAGFGQSATRSDAVSNAIRACEQAARNNNEIVGTCRIATSDQGNAAVSCVGTAQ